MKAVVSCPYSNERMALVPELDYFSPLVLKVCNKSMALLHPDWGPGFSHWQHQSLIWVQCIGIKLTHFPYGQVCRKSTFLFIFPGLWFFVCFKHLHCSRSPIYSWWDVEMAQGLTSYSHSSIKLTAAIKTGYFLEIVPRLFFIYTMWHLQRYICADLVNGWLGFPFPCKEHIWWKSDGVWGHKWLSAKGVVLKGWENNNNRRTCPPAKTLIIVKWTLSEAIGDYIHLHELEKALGCFWACRVGSKNSLILMRLTCLRAQLISPRCVCVCMCHYGSGNMCYSKFPEVIRKISRLCSCCCFWGEDRSPQSSLTDSSTSKGGL